MIDIPLAIYLSLLVIMVGLAIRSDARRRGRTKRDRDAERTRSQKAHAP
jgi:hypothetical protein